MLFSLHTFAQQGTASPYSFYGIGEVKFKGTVENRAMGGLGILNDSIHINLQNPATLSSLRLTTFTASGTFSPSKLRTSEAEEKAQRTSFDYLAIAFPAGKMGFSLGLMPYTAVGYKITQENSGRSSVYDATGGVNKFFVGSAYQISSKLSAGIELAYNFGKIETNSIVSQSGVQYGSKELNTSKLNGLTYSLGLNYKSKINQLDWISSVSFAPSIKLNSENARYTASSNNIDYYESDIPDSKVKLPTKFVFGSGVGQDKKWFVGLETTFQGKGAYSNLAVENASYKAASKISMGGYYIPKYNSFSNYFKRVTYRAGLRYEDTGLVLKTESIKDRAVTFGFGFPIGGSLSNINFSYELGKRGAIASGLIQENYQNFSIGLSFNDKWFTKRKYD